MIGGGSLLRNLDYLNEFRVKLNGMYGDENNGIFDLKIKGEKYRVVASNGEGWEHLSISGVKHKIPSWTTMCTVKDMFFDEEEVVIQIHPKKSEYINNVSNCLHLWKPINKEIPTPPSWMVGIKGVEFDKKVSN